MLLRKIFSDIIIITILLFVPRTIMAVVINPVQQRALHVVDSLKQKLNASTQDSSRLSILKLLGYELQCIDPQLAIEYINEGLALAEKTENDPQKIVFLDQTGSAYQVMHDFSKALFYRFQALRIAERLKLIRQQADIKNNIGSTYIETKQYKLAEKYLKEALLIRIRYNHYKDLPLLYTNLGALAGIMGNLDQCIEYCQKAIEIKQKYHTPFGLSLPYTNIADAYMEKNRLSDAWRYYTKALAEAITMEDVLDCYMKMGNIMVKENHYEEAILYYSKAENIADHNKIKRMLPELYQYIADAYAKHKDYRNAYAYKEKLSAVMNVAFNERVTEQMNEMQAKYETEKKDEQIRVLNKDKEIVQAKADKERLSRNMFIAILALVFTISIVIARNMVLKQRVKNKHLSEEKALVEKDNTKLLRENTEAKYEVLKSKTNPHFLFNSLSILSSIIMEDRSLAIEFITKFAALYRMILDTGNQQTIALNKEMDIVNNYLFLQKRRFENGLQLDIRIDPSEGEEYVVPPFALQMLVENAIKHNMISRTEQLLICAYLEDGYIVFRNNLRRKSSGVSSTFTGHKNIIERYKLLSYQQPVFVETELEYIARLPLLRRSRKDEKNELYYS